ncbi:MAG: GNAT family protein [Candidatus Limnocylindrales bacterium]
MAARAQRIRGRQVWLRALEASDLPAYKRAVDSVEVGSWAGYPWPHSDATIDRWYDDVRQRHGHGEYWFAISPLESDDFIGTIWLWSKGDRLDGLELSVFVTEEAGLGHGLGSDAVDAALDFIFGSYEVERVWLTTERDNSRAVRAFEKSGFSVDGTVRHHFRREGRWRDSALMAITRADWEALDRPRSWDLGTRAEAAGT